MKNLLVLTIFFINSVFGQTKEFIVTDTAAVGTNIHKEEIPTDTLPIITYDTSYYFNYDLIKTGGHFIAYYDRTHMKKAIEITIDVKGNQIGYKDYWYNNGQMKEHSKDTIFVKDFIFYDKTQWYPDGKIKQTNTFNGKDSTTSTYYYSNGNLKMREKEYYDKSLPHQLYCYHEKRFENGQLCNTPLIDNWLSKRQKVIFYFSNGKTRISSTLFFVQNIGKYEEWDKNGTLRISGQYEDYPTLEAEMIHSFHPTNKTGTWKYYNDTGQLIKEELFNEKGELISTTGK